MSSLSRRDFLKVAGLGLGSAMLATEAAQAAPPAEDANDHVGMLYDTTLCVGCHACSAACRDWNGTEVDLDPSGLYDAPTELTDDTWTLILLHQGENGNSFVKRQCMHCVDPGCVSGCPVHALQKTAAGPVTYDPRRCIGCRYCMYACPFDIPRFEWEEVLPEITKCTLCADRVAAGDGPACAERCPTGALIWGRRGDLLEAAEKRLVDHPNRYVNKVYGKDDAGGTSVLYLSHVPFEDLGLPDLGTEPITRLSERIGNVFIPSILLGGPLVLAGIRFISKRDGEG
ncbi:MAG: hydrogenase 2 operon protein HybA [Anaerolineales bacterium]|nr:MAG: hydrogenase 2 operon protein HybA [Anaerolineales bacterium]